MDSKLEKEWLRQGTWPFWERRGGKRMDSEWAVEDLGLWCPGAKLLGLPRWEMRRKSVGPKF